ncbi:MAG TPA: metallophosphoesterase family protein [Gaiellaceae bacterium]|nr:metallophosphoesterase family protein [Gaiellaceae bacterium]
MLVAVVADTHLPRGARTLPPECVRRLRAADLVLHAGDHSSLASLEELRALGPPVHAVHGNADEPALRELLPKDVVVEAGGLRIGMTHVPGPRVGREARLAARFPGCAAVVYGHTHVPQLDRHGKVWILNPGSPTERRRSPAHTMLELRVGEDGLRPELIRLA